MLSSQGLPAEVRLSFNVALTPCKGVKLSNFADAVLMLCCVDAFFPWLEEPGWAGSSRKKKAQTSEDLHGGKIVCCLETVA